jgi:glutaredoxin-like protein NrdH
MTTTDTTVTVYTKPACQQCKMTFRALDKAGVTYRSVDVTEDNDARGYVMSLGYLQAPVVVVETAATEHWSGFRPDKLDEIAA